MNDTIVVMVHVFVNIENATAADRGGQGCHYRNHNLKAT